MRKSLIILLFIVCNLAFSQSSEADAKFRVLTGVLLDTDGNPLPGQNVVVLGTSVGTQTDFEGKFTLLVPRQMTIYISLPFCFEEITRQVTKDVYHLELQIGKRKQISRSARKKWNRETNEMKAELKMLFCSKEYQTAKLKLK